MSEREPNYLRLLLYLLLAIGGVMMLLGGIVYSLTRATREF